MAGLREALHMPRAKMPLSGLAPGRGKLGTFLFMENKNRIAFKEN
jgi:hypothetical protein